MLHPEAPKPVFCVFTHCGVGYHSEKNQANYFRGTSACVLPNINILHCSHPTALKRACVTAAALDDTHDVLHAAVAATVVLEDEPITNAGCGSNLTESGIVETDASVMRGDGLWAAVGAVQGLANPILAAHCLAMDSLKPMPLGRVRPMYAHIRRPHTTRLALCTT